MDLNPDGTHGKQAPGPAYYCFSPLLFYGGTHLIVLRAYSCLCAQGSHLVVLGGEGTLCSARVKTGSALCKANTFPMTLPLPPCSDDKE